MIQRQLKRILQQFLKVKIALVMTTCFGNGGIYMSLVAVKCALTKSAPFKIGNNVFAKIYSFLTFSCPRRPGDDQSDRLPRPNCPVPEVLSHLFCLLSHIKAVLPSCPDPAILPRLSGPICPGPDVLF